MSRTECAHEADVLSAVYTRQWPDRAEPALRAHVETCALCQDVVAVVSAFDEVSGASRADLRVPDSSVVWWRAQVRAREEATRAALRPITIAQAVSFAVGLGVLGAVFGATATWFQQALRTVGNSLASAWQGFQVPAPPAALVAVVADHGLWLAAGAVFLLLTPVAVYFATNDK